MIANEEYKKLSTFCSHIQLDRRPTLSYQQFRKYWKEYEVIRLVPEIVNTLSIPDTSKRFLIEVGLPVDPVLDIHCDTLQTGLPTLSEVASNDFTYESKYHFDLLFSFEKKWASHIASFSWGGRLRLIGYTVHGVYLCIDEALNGVVVVVSGARDQIRFVNTNVELFAECLILRREYGKRVSLSIKEDEGRKLQKWLRKEFARIDPSAMKEGDWWPIYIEMLSYD